MAKYFTVVFVFSILCSSVYPQRHFGPEISNEGSCEQAHSLQKCDRGYFHMYRLSRGAGEPCCIEDGIPEWENYTLPIKKLDCRYRTMRYIINARAPDDVQIVDMSFSRGLRELVTTLSQSVFPCLPQVRSIILSSCWLNTLPPGLFEFNTKLDYVNLSWNQLKTLPQDLFSHAPDLLKVVMRRAGVISLPDNLFRNNPKLETLIISENQLTYLKSEMFASTPNLRYLDISENKQLSCIGDDLLSHIKKISFFNLKGTGAGIYGVLRHRFCDTICDKSLEDLKHLRETYSWSPRYGSGCNNRRRSWFSFRLPQVGE